MFRSALVKLTASYLAILLAISLFFSVLMFGVASREFTRTFNRPGILKELRLEVPGGMGKDRPALETLLQERIADSRHALAFNLFYLNLAVLAVGGIASYGLARWTLRPIERSHQAQSRFAADASHELRTPLTAMRTETEVTLGKPDLTLAQAREQLRSNLEELDKLGALTQGLLRLARLDADQLHARPVVLAEVVSQALDRVTLTAKHKQVALVREGLGQQTVLGDQAALVELLAILLDNAIKYTPEHGQVTVGMSRSGHGAVVSVRDQGPGIATEQLSHIFERFYRSDTSRNKQTPGYGIGLSIAKSIADMHGAELTAESAPGQGANFRIVFKR